jgi:hypothetical protein
VNGVREEVEKIGYERKAYFTRLKPTYVDGTIGQDQVGVLK